MGSAEIASIISGVAGAAALIVTATRTRRDVNVDEMERRIKSLEERLEKVASDLRSARSSLVECEASVFRYQRILAQNGIEDEPLDG